MADRNVGPLRELAAAKVNLFLHIEGRRADGMHELDSLVVFGDIGDTLVVADGTSCRHQINDGTGREAIHAARVLLMAVEAGREARA